MTADDRPARRRRLLQRHREPVRRDLLPQAEQFSGSFAIVLDGELVSRPIINFVDNPAGIDGRTGAQISGVTAQEAQDLAEVLKIGALPVKLALISQSTVSATLGQQALDQGLKAGLIGLGIVLLFLLFYYRLLGLIAGLGLIVYAIFYFAMIKALPITVTLPGIAGLVLTIGVAADSNIVIFERIKEEVRAGRSMLSAISEGYRKGIATIIDANVITLLTAFILFGLATAGVKGFALHARDRDDRLPVHRGAVHPGGARAPGALEAPALALDARRKRRGRRQELRAAHEPPAPPGHGTAVSRETIVPIPRVSAKPLTRLLRGRTP